MFNRSTKQQLPYESPLVWLESLPWMQPVDHNKQADPFSEIN